MEILILSDSHGNKTNVRRVLSDHPNAAMLLFCGDGTKDIASFTEDYPQLVCLAVRGNCDFLCCDEPMERLFDLFGKRILMMHGHAYGVKGGLGAAVAYAQTQNADILIYGHTHQPYEQTVTVKEKRITVFNPGSIGKRDNGSFSYGVLEMRDNGFLFSHGEIV